MAGVLIHYRGRRRDGAGCVGVEPVEDPAEFVAARFRQGWARLTVELDGREIGGIEPHPDNGRRTWWCETGHETTTNPTPEVNPCSTAC